MKIFCDLDGCLVDFQKAFKKLSFGISFDENTEQFGYNHTWGLINSKGSNWWKNLEWMEDGKILWDFIKEYNPTILTAASTRNTNKKAIIGKTKWCAEQLGIDVEVIITDSSKCKQKYAKKDYILIDDLKENIEEWIAAGGIGILHTSAEETIKQLGYFLI